MITKLELLDFGKFHNKTIQLDHDFNLIIGKNEAGKTTIYMFILAMLYGFSKDSTKRRVFTKEYDYYFPNNGASFKGAMELKLSQGKIRIERNFLKDRESCRVYNLDLSKEYSNDPRLFKYSRIPQPGVLCYGLSQKEFINLYHLNDFSSFSQEDLELSIQSVLENIQSTGSSQISLNRALRDLNEKKNKLGSTRAKLSPLGSIEEKINNLKELNRTLKPYYKNYFKILEESSHISARLNDVNHEIDALQIKKSDYVEILEGKKEENLLKKAVLFRDRLNELNHSIIQQEKELDEIEGKYPWLLETPKKKRDNSLYYFLGIILLIIFEVIIYVNNFDIEYNLILILLIIILLIKSLLERNRRVKRVSTRDKYNEKLQVLEHKQSLREDLLKNINSEFNLDADMSLMMVNKYLEQIITSSDYKIDPHLKELDFKLERLQDKKLQLSLMKKEIELDLDKYEKNRDNYLVNNRRIKLLYSEKERILFEQEAISETIKILDYLGKKTNIDLYNEFEKRVSLWFSELTNYNYDKVSLSHGKKIFIYSKGHKLSFEQLSRGTKDQLFLAIRIALIDFKASDDPFIVIDDGFIHFDSERFASALNVLNRRTEQILFFTNQQSITKILDQKLDSYTLIEL